MINQNYHGISNGGFGHNHFWVSDLNGVRLIFVEF